MARRTSLITGTILMFGAFGVGTLPEARAAEAAATTWAAWRGPLGTGVSPDGNPPIHWSEEQNIRFKVEVPGRGRGAGTQGVAAGRRAGPAALPAAGLLTPGRPVVFTEQRLPGINNVYASPVGAAGRIYLFGRKGHAVVLKHGDAFKLLAESDLGEGVDASPAIVGDTLYVRGERHLYAIAE